MNTKNARTLGVRLDATDTARISKFEAETNIEAVSLARAALKAALTAFETTGHLSLPLYVTDQPSSEQARMLKVAQTVETLSHAVKKHVDRIRKTRAGK